MPTIQKITMSKDGPVLSELVQGYWRFSEWDFSPQQRLTFIKQHIELGISTVDHAHVYGSPDCESLFGEALALEPSLRDSMEIISKCGIHPIKDRSKHVTHYCSTKEQIISSAELSLSRMNVSHLDVLLIHRPDLLMDADEVADAFLQLKAAGKVKHFGVSNFTAAQFSLLQSRLDTPLVTNQVEINPLNLGVTEDGTLDLLQQLRIRPMAWSCFASGRLFSDQSEQMIRLRKTLSEIADELAEQRSAPVTIDQVTLCWVRKLPCQPLPILGSKNIDRIQLAVNALGLIMNREQWYRIWTASKGHGVA